MLAVALALTVIILGGLLIAVWSIKSYGIIKGVGIEVYWDAAGTNPCTEIDWGMLTPGERMEVPVYIKNIKNTNVTLTMNTSNWSPWYAEGYITQGWDYVAGVVVDVNQTVLVTLILDVSSDIENVENFSFDISIYATEYVPPG